MISKAFNRKEREGRRQKGAKNSYSQRRIQAIREQEDEGFAADFSVCSAVP
jgi:hypothetical protein